VVDVPDVPGTVAALFQPLADAHINVDVIVQNISFEGRTDVTFTVPRNEADQAVALANAAGAVHGWGKLLCDKQVTKISVVGAGMRSQPGVALRMFAALGKADQHQLISTSEIKISCVIEDKYTELAVRVLHDAFELEKPPSERGV